MTTYQLVFEEPPPLTRPPAGKATRRQRRARPAVQTYVAPDSHRPHGSHAKYVVERCRCEACRAGNRAYERGRRRAMARPDQAWVPYVDAARARRHCHELRAAGLGLKTIAKLAGVSHGTLSKLVYGDRRRGMKPSRRIRPATEARILAVTIEHATGRQRIPAGPTWALVEDLLAQGFTRAWITQQLGRRSQGLQLGRDRVLASTARRVEQLHAAWTGTTPPTKRSRRTS